MTPTVIAILALLAVIAIAACLIELAIASRAVDEAIFSAANLSGEKSASESFQPRPFQPVR